MDIWNSDKQKELKANNPDMPQKEIFGQAASLWKLVSEKDKAKYNKLAEKQKEIQEKHLEER